MTGKRRNKPASPVPETLVAETCAGVYRRSLGEYDARSMVEKDEEKRPGCGDSLLRKRAMIYQKTVRFALLDLHSRGLLLIQVVTEEEIPELPGDDPVDSDDIPEVEE